MHVYFMHKIQNCRYITIFGNSLEILSKLYRILAKAADSSHLEGWNQAVVISLEF